MQEKSPAKANENSDKITDSEVHAPKSFQCRATKGAL